MEPTRTDIGKPQTSLPKALYKNIAQLKTDLMH